MTIAAHISFENFTNDAGSNFNYSCLTRLAIKFPSHHFIFIFDKPFDTALIKASNITPVLLGPVIKNRLLQHYWYNLKLPRLLNKYNADVFITGDHVCSLRTKTAQCMLIPDLSFVHTNKLFPKNDARYLKRYLKAFTAKADQVIVLNTTIQSTLIKLFPVIENKITTIKSGIDDKKDYNGEQLEAVKEKITAGKEYFLFFGTKASVGNSITLLKAFSIFKKWQKSNMQLLLFLPGGSNAGLEKNLATYKYRGDVHISYPTETDPGLLAAAAYAAIYLPVTDVAEAVVFYALQQTIPLIVTDQPFFLDVFADGALFSKPNEIDIAEKMMLLYKDERYREELARRGKAMAATFNWDLAASLLWERIEAAADR